MYTLILLLTTLLTTTLALPLAVSQGMNCFKPDLCLADVGPGQEDPWNDPRPKPKPKLVDDDKRDDENDLILDRRGDEMVDEAVDESGMAGVYICTSPSWAGSCTYTKMPTGGAPSDCTIIPSEQKASSIGPDPGFYCIFYTNALCTSLTSDFSDALGLHYPGSPDLRTTQKGDFNGRVLSYQCFEHDENSVVDEATRGMVVGEQ